MRMLYMLVLAGLPGAALAQVAQTTVQKAAQAPLGVQVSAADLGLPANPDAPKVALLTASWAGDATASDFDTDKVAGNDPATAPLALRTKAPGMLPEPAPAAADLGDGPDGEKVAALLVAKATDGRVSTYDTDKIDGNPETYPPLALRQKAPGQVPDGVAAAAFGQPANLAAPKTGALMASHADGSQSIYDEDKIDGNEPPPEPLGPRQKAAAFLTATLPDADLGILDSLPLVKSADLAVSHADGVETIYDEDKITGNEETYVEGPLAARQKYPSDLMAGTDPATFGIPATDAPKEADLGISKAELAIPSIEDNDKIAGNPYVPPPLLPRQKLPSVLPDPVIDADMGQPAIDVARVELAVSKAADDQPTVEDNDKIAGNPVVNPPLPARTKAPSYDTVTTGLSDTELGLPAADAEKVAQVQAGKAAEAVITEYDEDKIAGNSYADPGLDGFGTDFAEVAPPPELIAAVRTALDDPTTRSVMMDGVAARALAPAAVTDAFAQFIGALFDAPAVRDLMAPEMARVFMDMGLQPDNPVAVGRMAAEYISVFGEAEARRGMSGLPADEQRAYLAGLLRIAGTMTAPQCGPFLQGTLDASQTRRLMLTAIAGWSDADRNALLIQRAAAAITAVQNTATDGMSDGDVQTARATLGAAASAAIDAAPNADALFAAFGDPAGADPANLCAVQQLILEQALAITGPDGDVGVRYLVEFGWQN